MHLPNSKYSPHIGLKKLQNMMQNLSQDNATHPFTNLYHPILTYSDLLNILVDGLACCMLVSVCLLGNSLNVHSNPEKLRPSRDTTDIQIHLLKVKVTHQLFQK
jgi:hypothetical protein